MKRNGRGHIGSAVVLMIMAAACAPRPSVSSAPSLTKTSSPAASIAPAVSKLPDVSVDSIMAHDMVLSKNIGARAKGSAGEAAAADHIAASFDAAGCQTRRQPFARKMGGTSENVICRFPGVGYGRGYVVVGAHYDTIAVSPGGNDNGSGVAVILALAEAFAKARAPIEFVCFSAEEKDDATKASLEGSKAYVAAVSGQNEKVTQMLSLDMVGNGPSMIITEVRKHPSQLANDLLSLAQNVGMASSKGPAGNVSDHAPFASVGVDAAALWSGRRPEYHSAADTFETVHRDSVERAAVLTRLWLKQRFSL